MIKLFILRHDDYRTGTELKMLDIIDLIDEIKDENIVSEYEPVEKLKGNINEKKAVKIIMSYEYLFDSLKIKNPYIDDKYLIYTVTGDYDNHEITHIKNFNFGDDHDVTKFMEQIYSDVNKCQEFVATDYTSSYKEDGYYPNPLPLVDNKAVLNKNLIKRIYNNYYCIVFVLYNGCLYNYKQIRPIF